LVKIKDEASHSQAKHADMSKEGGTGRSQVQIEPDAREESGGGGGGGREGGRVLLTLVVGWSEDDWEVGAGHVIVYLKRTDRQARAETDPSLPPALLPSLLQGLPHQVFQPQHENFFRRVVHDRYKHCRQSKAHPPHLPTSLPSSSSSTPLFSFSTAAAASSGLLLLLLLCRCSRGSREGWWPALATLALTEAATAAQTPIGGG